MKEETTTMDDVLAKHSSNFRKYLDKDYGSKFNVCINGFEAQNAMTEWEQIKVAPLLKRIEELEDKLQAAKMALKEIYTGTDFPLSIAQNALQIINQ